MKTLFAAAIRGHRPAGELFLVAARKHGLGRHRACEVGSPKLPQGVEAVMLHALDDLDGKIQTIQNLAAREPGCRRTVFRRAFGRSFYRGDTGATSGG